MSAWIQIKFRNKKGQVAINDPLPGKTSRWLCQGLIFGPQHMLMEPKLNIKQTEFTSKSVFTVIWISFVTGPSAWKLQEAKQFGPIYFFSFRGIIPPVLVLPYNRFHTVVWHKNVTCFVIMMIAIILLWKALMLLFVSNSTARFKEKGAVVTNERIILSTICLT